MYINILKVETHILETLMYDHSHVQARIPQGKIIQQGRTQFSANILGPSLSLTN